jgi:hypothetical protein
MGPRSHSHLTRLSRQLRRATPEQVEAIERILAGPAVSGRLQPDQPRYALHREGSLWRLAFDDGRAILKHEQGICYVAEMLSRPRERVKKLNLAARYSSSRSQGGSGIEIYDPATGKYEPPASMEPVHEGALAADDDEARRAYEARARELKETIEDPTETERAKVEAREELEAIAAHLGKDSRTVRDPTKSAADAARIGINRFLRNLRQPANRPTARGPRPGLAAGAAIRRADRRPAGRLERGHRRLPVQVQPRPKRIADGSATARPGQLQVGPAGPGARGRAGGGAP